MIRFIIAGMVCALLHSPCVSEEAQQDAAPFAKVMSPASLIQENADGSLLVNIQPRIYNDELGCTTVSDEHGNTFAQVYQLIAFTIDDSVYYTIWGVRYGDGPPVKLDPEKQYRFEIRPLTKEESKSGQEIWFLVHKIWDGEKLIHEKPVIQMTDE